MPGEVAAAAGVIDLITTCNENVHTYKIISMAFQSVRHLDVYLYFLFKIAKPQKTESNEYKKEEENSSFRKCLFLTKPFLLSR